MAVKVAKAKVLFRCQECGYASAKWLGKCPDCGKWNAFVEEKQAAEPALKRPRLTDFSSAVNLLSEISHREFDRITTGIGEFDRMIGGGVVPGSLVVLGGPPGIGKSTLMLQIAAGVAAEKKVLYVSGEESQEQVKSRADRLGVSGPQLYLLSETNLETILEAARRVEPELLIVDSIQTTYRNDLASAPGSVGQVRECAAELLRLAKSSRTCVFLLGHVTKEGDLAGPRVLEHIVDTVLYFETEHQQAFRVLRACKNRFGPTSEIGVFEMHSEGLLEVKDPSRLFLAERHRGPGSVLVSAVEGSRPLLLEIQALVSRTYFGMPRRMVTGVDYNRVLLMAAVLEKRLNLNIGSQDIFVNVTGGARAREPGIDLGIAAAIAGAFGNFSPAADGLLVGEVGLGGEVRAVAHLEERIREAERLGVAWAVVPQRGERKALNSDKVKIIRVGTVREAIDWLTRDTKS